jgi:thiol-disulfide isomerase/thioredoxin
MVLIALLLNISVGWAGGADCQRSLSLNQDYLEDLVERSIAALKESGKFADYDALPVEFLASEIEALKGNDPFLYSDLLARRMSDLTATQNVIEITSEEQFKNEVLEATPGDLIMVDVYGSYCAPCREILPVVNQLADLYVGQIKVVKVNIAEQKWYEANYGGVFKGLMVPVMHFFQNGRIVKKYGPEWGNRRKGIEKRIRALLQI